MKNKKPNAELVWKQLEDLLAPRLGLNLTERVVYAHLLRHSRLEGKRQLRFSIPWLARRPPSASLEEMDFLQVSSRREAIHAREHGLCFYCLRRFVTRGRVLDHVVPPLPAGGAISTAISFPAVSNATRRREAVDRQG